MINAVKINFYRFIKKLISYSIRVYKIIRNIHTHRFTCMRSDDQDNQEPQDTQETVTEEETVVEETEPEAQEIATEETVTEETVTEETIIEESK
jgi:hypothetical protein